MKQLLIATVVALALSGCAATGPAIEPQQVTAMQKGRTTFNDVVRQFGKPSLNSKNMDGTRTAIYLQPGNDEPGSIVSLATVIAGTSVGSRETVTFEFDEKDVLTDYRWKQATPAPAAVPASSSPSAAPAATTRPYQTAPGAAAHPITDAPPASAAATKPAQSGAAGTTPRPAPATTPAPVKPRNDGLPGWLPGGNYDPRDPFK